MTPVDTLRLLRRGGEPAASTRRGLVRRALPRVPRRDRRARSGAARVPVRLRERPGDGDPDRAQGRDRHARDPDDRRLEDPRELRPGLRRDRRRATAAARGLPRARQDEHRRVRDGLVDGELGLRAVAQPVGPDARARRLGRRLARPRSRRARAVGARLRHRRLDQAAGGVLRQRRAAADLRHGLALRRRRVRLEPRPGRPGDAKRPRQRASLPDHRRPRRERLDDGRTCRRSSCRRRRSEGPPHRRPAAAERGRRDRAGRVKAAVDAAIELARDARRERRGVRAAAVGRLRRRLLLPDRARRGVGEPRALRRRALRAARRRRRLPRDGHADARRRVRRRAEAADHARHLRALVRLLRRLLRHRAEGADGDQARARRAVRALRRARLADERRRSRSRSARRSRTRSRCT